jgi:hypothetical protein
MRAEFEDKVLFQCRECVAKANPILNRFQGITERLRKVVEEKS